MGVSAPMVTKYIGHLEQTLGSRLLNRSTHSLSLTDAGQAYYQRCVQLLEDLEEAESAAGAQNASPRGSLRMSVSTDLLATDASSVLAASAAVNTGAAVGAFSTGTTAPSK